jgi:parallel beta-helix repeat protein
MIRRLLILLTALIFVLPFAPYASAADDESLTAALAERSKDRIRQLGALAVDSPDSLPFRRVDGATGMASIILPAKDEPYTFAELIETFPVSFSWIDEGEDLLLKDDVIVGEGAQLSIDSSTAATIRLLSTPDRFVTITSWRGKLEFTGTESRPLRIFDWNPDDSSVDTELADGRSWIHTRRGVMSMRWVDATYLGFATGSLSGVAWEGRSDDPARGNVSYSTFSYNYFGAYTFEAIEMEWRFNTFSHNLGYGFDPHDHSDRFIVEYNVAEYNGTHGIIFSRGCKSNTIQFNQSSNNGQHGIVLDDGPNFNPDGTLRDRPGIASDSNLVRYNVVFGNDVGIVLDGGTENVVSDNVVSYNNIGVRMKDAVVANHIDSNKFINNTKIGVYLYNGSDSNDVTDNSFTGGGIAIELKDSRSNQILGNDIRDVTSSAIYLVGDVSETTIHDNHAESSGSELNDSHSTGNVSYTGNNFGPEKAESSQWSIAASAKRGAIWSLLLLFPLLGWPYIQRAVGFLRHRTGRFLKSA